MELEELVGLLRKKGLTLSLTCIVDLWVVHLKTREGAEFHGRSTILREALRDAHTWWWSVREKPIYIAKTHIDRPWGLYAEVVRRHARLMLPRPNQPATLTWDEAVAGANMLGFTVTDVEE